MSPRPDGSCSRGRTTFWSRRTNTGEEPSRGPRVHKKAVATAEAGRRVVVVVQEAPREGEQKSRRAYQSLSGIGVKVDAVLFFPAGTIASASHKRLKSTTPRPRAQNRTTATT